MKQLHANLILVCVFLCLALFTVTQNWKLSDYSNMITDLTNKLKNSETKLSEAEERTFALGENLWNKKHTYDIKFLIGDNNTEHEFYAHKYILTANSPYFEILFSKNTTNVISYTDIHKKQFNSVLELLYFGKFQSDVSLSSLPNVLKYMDKYMILEKYTNYTDSYFSNLFNNTSTNEELFDVDLVSSIYDVSLDNKLIELRSEIMKIMYTSWRKYNAFDKTDIVNHPKLFYDYIRFLNC